MTNEDITQALEILAPGSSWSLIGNNYDDIQWYSKDAKPSIEELEATISKLPKLAIEKKAEEDAQAQANAAAKAALLDRLGITADEAKLLLA